MQEQHSADAPLIQGSITDLGQHHSTEQQPGVRQETPNPKSHESHGLNTGLSSADAAAANPLSTLVNYSSSDEET